MIVTYKTFLLIERYYNSEEVRKLDLIRPSFLGCRAYGSRNLGFVPSIDVLRHYDLEINYVLQCSLLRSLLIGVHLVHFSECVIHFLLPSLPHDRLEHVFHESIQAMSTACSYV